MRASIGAVALSGVLALTGVRCSPLGGEPLSATRAGLGGDGSIPLESPDAGTGCSPTCWGCEVCIDGRCVWDYARCPCDRNYGAGPGGSCTLGCPDDQLHEQRSDAGRTWLCGQLAATAPHESASDGGTRVTLRGRVPLLPLHRKPLCQSVDAGEACQAGWVVY